MDLWVLAMGYCIHHRDETRSDSLHWQFIRVHSKLIPLLSAPPTFVTNLLFSAFLDAASFSWLTYHVVHFESLAYMIIIHSSSREFTLDPRYGVSKPRSLAPAIIYPAQQKLLQALCTLTLAGVWRVASQSP